MPIKKISRSNLSRADGGAKRKPDRAWPQEKLGEILRPEEFRRTDHPVCGASVASRLLINAAATPPFQGGEFPTLECAAREGVLEMDPSLLFRANSSRIQESQFLNAD